MILPAEINDSKTLTKIAIASKAHWNYEAELLKSWQDDLTVSVRMIETMNVFKFVINQKIIGFYILNNPKNSLIELQFLFVQPDFIGQNIGKKLLLHAFNFAQNLNCTTMQVLSDPNAEKFYQHFNFITVAKQESSVKNRFLPILQRTL